MNEFDWDSVFGKQRVEFHGFDAIINKNCLGHIDFRERRNKPKPLGWGKMMLAMMGVVVVLNTIMP